MIRVTNGTRPIFIPAEATTPKMRELKLKSIAVLVPAERIQASLQEMGFSLQSTATTVSDGKFWDRLLYVKGAERVSLSEEMGDAYPKDPIITIYGSSRTIDRIFEVVG